MKSLSLRPNYLLIRPYLLQLSSRRFTNATYERGGGGAHKLSGHSICLKQGVIRLVQLELPKVLAWCNQAASTVSEWKIKTKQFFRVCFTKNSPTLSIKI
jgi:hypothetical protein